MLADVCMSLTSGAAVLRLARRSSSAPSRYPPPCPDLNTPLSMSAATDDRLAHACSAASPHPPVKQPAFPIRDDTSSSRPSRHSQGPNSARVSTNSKPSALFSPNSRQSSSRTACWSCNPWCRQLPNGCGGTVPCMGEAVCGSSASSDKSGAFDCSTSDVSECNRLQELGELALRQVGASKARASAASTLLHESSRRIAWRHTSKLPTPDMGWAHARLHLVRVCAARAGNGGDFGCRLRLGRELPRNIAPPRVPEECAATTAASAVRDRPPRTVVGRGLPRRKSPSTPTVDQRDSKPTRSCRAPSPWMAIATPPTHEVPSSAGSTNISTSVRVGQNAEVLFRATRLRKRDNIRGLKKLRGALSLPPLSPSDAPQPASKRCWVPTCNGEARLTNRASLERQGHLTLPRSPPARRSRASHPAPSQEVRPPRAPRLDLDILVREDLTPQSPHEHSNPQLLHTTFVCMARLVEQPCSNTNRVAHVLLRKEGVMPQSLVSRRAGRAWC